MRLSNTTGILQKKTLWFIAVEVKDESPGGGGTPLQDANGDVPLDGVASSRLD